MEYIISHAGKDVIFSVEAIDNDLLRKAALDAIQKFYGQFSPASGKESILKYKLTDRIDNFFDSKGEVIMSEAAKKNDYQVFMNGHGNRLGYEYKDGKLKTIYFNLTYPGRIQDNKHKATSRAFLSNVESQIATMYSKGFLHGLQLKNLEVGTSFLHACSFEKEGKGYVISATPGAGKSSLLLSLVSDANTKFIGDDFSCVDSKGFAYHVGRSMAIKSHQIQYFPWLREALDDMTKMQRLQWFLLKKKGLKKMAAPSQLFKERISFSTPIHKAIYLTNHNSSSFDHSEIPVKEFADLNANMLFSELFLGMEIANRALILPGKHLLPTADEFISLTRNTLINIFSAIPCVLVKAPFRSDPRELRNYLEENEII